MEHPLLNRLMHVNRSINQRFNRKLKPYKMRLSHFRVLHHVFMKEGATQNELAASLDLDKITMAKMMEKLVREGYVEKRADREDKRYYSVYSTSLAKEKQEEFREIVNEINEVLRDAFSEEESDNVVVLLDRLLERLEESEME